nr:pitrilysin family protein [Lysobacter enzymogenes]
MSKLQSPSLSRLCRMRLRRSLVPAALAALAVLALAPAAASPASAAPVVDADIAVPPLAYTERTLGNGLRVYALPDPDAGEVAVNLWYGVGGRDDPKDRAGLAHLLEHLMFKATRNLPAGRFATLAEDIGGSDDASTEDDYTRYYETVPPAYLERILFTEAERMGALVIDAATLASEREVVKEEIRTRLQSQDFGRLVQADLPAASYARLPYARPAIGRPEDLDRITLAEVRAFRAAYYRPDNAALIVSGRFDPAQLQRWVDRYFGPIARPAQPLPRLAATAEPARRAPLRRSVHAGHAVAGGGGFVRVAAGRAPDTPALMALDAIVSRGAGSRLDTRLVQAGHAQAASSLFERRRYGGYLAIYAILAGDADPAAGEAALAAQIADLRARPVATAELLRAKRLLLAAALRERETPDGRALALGRALAVAGDAAADQRQWRALAAVSGDVQRRPRLPASRTRRVAARPARNRDGGRPRRSGRGGRERDRKRAGDPGRASGRRHRARIRARAVARAHRDRGPGAAERARTAPGQRPARDPRRAPRIAAGGAGADRAGRQRRGSTRPRRRRRAGPAMGAAGHDDAPGAAHRRRRRSAGREPRRRSRRGRGQLRTQHRPRVAGAGAGTARRPRAPPAFAPTRSRRCATAPSTASTARCRNLWRWPAASPRAACSARAATTAWPAATRPVCARRPSRTHARRTHARGGRSAPH